MSNIKEFLKDRALKNIIGSEDLERIKSEDLVLFTGRGVTSSNLHLGHEYLYELIAKVSRTYKIPVYFQIATDEKRHSSKGYTSFEKITAQSKILHRTIRAFDFNELKIFSNTNPPLLASSMPRTVILIMIKMLEKICQSYLFRYCFRILNAPLQEKQVSLLFDWAFLHFKQTFRAIYF